MNATVKDRNGNAVIDVVAILLFNAWMKYGKTSTRSGPFLSVPAQYAPAYSLEFFSRCTHLLFHLRQKESKTLVFFCNSSNSRSSATSVPRSAFASSSGMQQKAAQEIREEDRKRAAVEVNPDFKRPIYPLPAPTQKGSSNQEEREERASAKARGDVVKIWESAFSRIHLIRNQSFLCEEDGDDRFTARQFVQLAVGIDSRSPAYEKPCIPRALPELDMPRKQRRGCPPFSSSSSSSQTSPEAYPSNPTDADAFKTQGVFLADAVPFSSFSPPSPPLPALALCKVPNSRFEKNVASFLGNLEKAVIKYEVPVRETLSDFVNLGRVAIEEKRKTICPNTNEKTKFEQEAQTILANLSFLEQGRCVYSSEMKMFVNEFVSSLSSAGVERGLALSRTLENYSKNENFYSMTFKKLFSML